MKHLSKMEWAIVAAVVVLLAGMAGLCQEQHMGPMAPPPAGAGSLSLDATGLKMPSGVYLAENVNVPLQGYQTIFGDRWGQPLVQSTYGGTSVYFGNGGYAATFGAASNTFLGDVIAFRPAHFIGDGSMISYPQTASAPTAASIGGTVGSVTNHVLVNIGGALTDYYSDGATVWSQQLVPPPALGK